MQITKEKLEEMRKEMEAQQAQGIAMSQQATGALLAIKHLTEVLERDEDQE